jgi:hypothetical protein
MKRIALIVTSTAVFAAGCGVGTARGSAHIIEPYPAQATKKPHRLAPNTAYRFLNPNPVSPSEQATTQTPPIQTASRGVVDLVNLPS